MVNEIKDGGTAFPAMQYANGISPTGHSVGISMRDYFAAKAMQGMLAKQGNSLIEKDRFSEWCYQMADAMLKAREK